MANRINKRFQKIIIIINIKYKTQTKIQQLKITSKDILKLVKIINEKITPTNKKIKVQNKNSKKIDETKSKPTVHVFEDLTSIKKGTFHVLNSLF